MTLADIHTGNTCTALSLSGGHALRHRLLSMGVTPGTEITVRKTAPLGDPVEIRLRGYSLTLRRTEAAAVEVIPQGDVKCR